MERVLIATRGEMAMRLIAHFREKGIETVSVFSEPDVDQPWVEEADYPVYLNGQTVEDTYLNARKVLSAAMDAGCEVIHPGYNFLAERIDFFDMAHVSNVAVIGADPKPLLEMGDALTLRRKAEKLGLPLLPGTDVVPDSSDGLAEGLVLGFPLLVKSAAAGLSQRVNGEAELVAAVASVREWSEKLSDDGRVFLTRIAQRARHVGTVVVGDRMGRVIPLGHLEGSVRAGGHSWLEEFGPGLLSEELSERLIKASVALTRSGRWLGIARVNWAIMGNSAFLLGFSGRLTTGYSLVEQVLNIDLVEAQISVQHGEVVGFDRPDEPERYGLQVRILHGDPANGFEREEGEITVLELPESAGDVKVEVGTAEGLLLGPLSDSLIAKITVTAPTRQSAIVRLRAVLEEVKVEGIATNRDALLDALGDSELWAGGVDSGWLVDRLG